MTKTLFARSPEATQAGLILRVLLRDPRADADELDWSVALRLAERNRVLVRLADAVMESGEPLPGPYADAVARARARARHAAAVAGRLDALFGRMGIAHVFLKLAQHYPDPGADLDVLLAATPRTADDVVRLNLPGAPHRTVAERLAGAVRFTAPDDETVLDVHCGRLGRLGEHSRYPLLLLRRRRATVVDGARCCSPSPEDQLLVQALQRVYGDRALRIADVYWTILTVRAGRIDWRYVVGTAHAMGLLPGLSCYLDYVEQVHRTLGRGALLPSALRDRLDRPGWGRVEFREGGYRFPAARVGGRLYLEAVRANLRSGSWASAARLCLAPVAAVIAAWRSVTRVAWRPAVA